MDANQSAAIPHHEGRGARGSRLGVRNKGFKDLAVWQKAKDLAMLIYRVSNSEMKSVDFGLRYQVRRSSVSVASNLAEGDERDTDKKSVRYFFHCQRFSR